MQLQYSIKIFKQREKKLIKSCFYKDHHHQISFFWKCRLPIKSPTCPWEKEQDQSKSGEMKKYSKDVKNKKKIKKVKSKLEFFFQNLPKLNNGGLTFFSTQTTQYKMGKLQHSPILFFILDHIFYFCLFRIWREGFDQRLGRRQNGFK